MSPMKSLLFAAAVGLCAATAATAAPAVADEAAAGAEERRCAEPGYWPVPGTGGCLKIDGSGDVPDGTLPSTVMGVPGAYAASPDLSVAFKVSQSWGSVQLSGVSGSVDTFSAAADQQTLGWGISASGDINLPDSVGAGKLGANLHFGDGAQRFMLGRGLSVSDVYNTLPIGAEAETLESWGGSIWVQHWWSDTIRSNLVGGVVATDVPASIAALSPAMTDRAIYGGANVVWSPMSQLDLGLEVIYGRTGSIGNDTVPAGEDDLFRFQASVQKTF